jgi:hypothetical protein
MLGSADAFETFSGGGETYDSNRSTICVEFEPDQGFADETRAAVEFLPGSRIFASDGSVGYALSNINSVMIPPRSRVSIDAGATLWNPGPSHGGVHLLRPLAVEGLR